MYQACVALDMPLDSAAVSGFGMPFNASDFSIYFCGWLDKVAFIVQAEAPSSSMRARESESNCRPGGVSPFAHVVVMAGMVSLGRDVPEGLSFSDVVGVARFRNQVVGTCGALSM